MTQSTLTNFLLALALAILLGLGIWLAPQLAPKRDTTLPLSTCDLNQGACSVSLPDGGLLEVEITPRPIPTLKPLSLRARLQGLDATSVLVDFSGVDMDMGFNQTQLNPTAPALFTGQGNLPICVTGSMRWQASFLIEGQHGTLAVPFHFNSGS